MNIRAFPEEISVVLSCEHGGNIVPDEFRELFRNASDVLESHRGWDPGALELFFEMVNSGVDFSIFSETTRLLIDLNRSLNKRTLFSEFTRPLDSLQKLDVIDRYYRPFREQFFFHLKSLAHENRFIFHVSVHSFTPVLEGKKRNADIGLLYDPRFGSEKEMALMWRKMISDRMPGLRIRMNYPYQGKNDGHVFALRNQLGPGKYAGIELEINQKYASSEGFNRDFGDVFKDFLSVLR
ncbi:N-formylglutamate amidohydrolase [Marinilabilia sp.]|uniref:N-formylglutamate amidohydrolase n=1 Tax=Marinilabilia sp. TaxID=2021252 RepID=UPI0025C0D7B9|nr:N-formylglutamate amidohydrolase [Marinilabilia sp.]